MTRARQPLLGRDSTSGGSQRRWEELARIPYRAVGSSQTRVHDSGRVLGSILNLDHRSHIVLSDVQPIQVWAKKGYSHNIFSGSTGSFAGRFLWFSKLMQSGAISPFCTRISNAADPKQATK